MKTKVNVFEKIGEIGVDAGLCWIGDPCYILHADPKPESIGKDWRGFCGVMRDDGRYPDYKQFNFDSGHTGLGVAVCTGYGDGLYPVFAEFNDQGRIAKVLIQFIGDADAIDET